MVKIKKYRVRISPAEVAFNCINITFMIFLMYLMLYPILHILFASFSDPELLMKHSGPIIKPLGFSFKAYKAVFQNRLIGSGYVNTLMNVFWYILLSVTFTTMGAFALSRKELAFRKSLSLLITFTMVFSGGLIPLYLLVKGLGISNTRWALIFPTIISAYNLIIMRTSFEVIPESLFESARMDGANELYSFVTIAVPVSIPVISVMVLFYGVDQWNAWFPAYIFLKERALWPLQLVLREIVIANTMSDMLTSVDVADKGALGEAVKYATVIVATVPILLVYPFLQKYFVKGVMIGAIKG